MQWCMFDSYAITAVLHKRIRGTNLVQVLLVVLDINTILDKACAGFNISLCSINIDIDDLMHATLTSIHTRTRTHVPPPIHKLHL